MIFSLATNHRQQKAVAKCCVFLLQMNDHDSVAYFKNTTRYILHSNINNILSAIVVKNNKAFQEMFSCNSTTFCDEKTLRFSESPPSSWPLCLEPPVCSWFGCCQHLVTVIKTWLNSLPVSILREL